MKVERTVTVCYICGVLFSFVGTWWNQGSPKTTVFVNVSNTLSFQSLVLANPLPWKQTSLQQETFRGRGKMFVSFIWLCVAQKLNEVILMGLSIRKISWYCIGFVCMVYIHYHSKIRTPPEPLLCDTH